VKAARASAGNLPKAPRPTRLVQAIRSKSRAAPLAGKVALVTAASRGGSVMAVDGSFNA
jgi:hypothetical protein